MHIIWSSLSALDPCLTIKTVCGCVWPDPGTSLTAFAYRDGLARLRNDEGTRNGKDDVAQFSSQVYDILLHSAFFSGHRLRFSCLYEDWLVGEKELLC